jgi:hypothetical protein
MKSSYENDPILEIAREIEEAKHKLGKELEEKKALRAAAQGIYELAQTHSFKSIIDKLQQAERLAINRMILNDSGHDFHFDRGWVFGIRAALGLIRDTDKAIKVLDQQIGRLKADIGSSKTSSEEQAQ